MPSPRSLRDPSPPTPLDDALAVVIFAVIALTVAYFVWQLARWLTL